MGKDKKRVVERGREIERRLGITLVENMKIGDQSSLCPSRISKMGVVLYTSTTTQGISWGDHETPNNSNIPNIIINTASTYIPTIFGRKVCQHAMTTRTDTSHPEPATHIETETKGEMSKPPHEPTQEEWNRYLFKETDGITLGAKAGMKSRERKMTKLELHMRHGHIGSHDGRCVVCNLLRGSFRSIHNKTSPYIEERVGHTFCGDVITWSDRSRKGSKYTMVLRDVCSGYFFLIHAIFRNEFTRRIESLVTTARESPLFKNLKRPIISALKLDPAGEWRNDNKTFQAMAKRIGLTIMYSSPDDKRSHAHGENAVKQIEIMARSILLNRALPTSFIEDACDQAACVRNYYPLVRDCVSGDGDAHRPLERVTGGGISRREIDNRLHHLIPIGTPCLIYQPKNKSSNLQVPKARWGIAIRMDKDMPIFFCPFRGPGTQFRSKNYIEYTLGIGINFYKFLGLEEPPMPDIALPHPSDNDIDITTISQIDDMGDLVGATTYGPPPIEEVRDPSKVQQPLITITDQDGWVYEHDSSGDITKSTKRIRMESNPPDDNDEERTHTIDLGTEEAPDPTPIEPEPSMDTMERHIVNHPATIIDKERWSMNDLIGPIKAKISDYASKTQSWVIIDHEGTQRQMTISDLIREIPRIGTSEAPTSGDSECIVELFPTLEEHLRSTPMKFVGIKFWKTFDGYIPCQGTITQCYPDDNMWNAKYLDGDTEDFDIHDMVETLEKSATIKEEEDTRMSTETNPNYTCKEGENFFNVCDSIGLQIHLRKVYYAWLGDGYGQFGEGWDPKNPDRHGIYFNYPWGRGRKTIFRCGTIFPMPMGESWSKALSDLHAKGLKSNPRHEIAMATRLIEKKIIMSEWLRDAFRKEAPSGARKSKSDIIDKNTGKIKDPKNIEDAMSRPDKGLWERAIRKELDALDELGVLSHGHRLDDIRKMGITNSAVPMQLLYDVKYHPDGELDKYKVRDVVQGHKGYMRKGEHFYNTFSASPSCRTTRLLQALTIGLNLHRHAWDICTAYLWADVRDDERMPVRYPKDLRREDPKTGEELYAILLKNCYGMPQADRRYTQLRNKFILTEFNGGGWQCKKSRQDPCLFIFKSPSGHSSYVIIHTDDCDGHGENMDDLKHIANKFHERFKIKVCDPRFMLGVQRDITTNEQTMVRTMTLTQPDFINTTYNTFKDHCPTRDIHTPFPPGMVLHSLMGVEDPNKAKELIGRGYQSIAGSILWAARNCYPEASLGANMICRLMSRPTDLSWKCALHTLKYLHGQQHRGIRYRSDGNTQPICYYDASNKADPSDGKSQYGYVIFLFNGPILWGSKKHNHVGLSSTHNEYMALSQASKDIEWIRQILIEIGYPLEKGPTPTLGDNDNATLYSREDLISPGNKFIIQDYHYAKECVERGVTCPRRVDTKDNISDILTKSVTRPIITRLRPPITGYGGLLDRPPDPPRD